MGGMAGHIGRNSICTRHKAVSALGKNSKRGRVGPVRKFAGRELQDTSLRPTAVRKAKMAWTSAERYVDRILQHGIRLESKPFTVWLVKPKQALVDYISQQNSRRATAIQNAAKHGLVRLVEPAKVPLPQSKRPWEKSLDDQIEIRMSGTRFERF